MGRKKLTPDIKRKGFYLKLNPSMLERLTQVAILKGMKKTRVVEACLEKCLSDFEN